MSIRSNLHKFTRCCSGIAAVEFGLLAPFLLISLVMMVDVGFAVESRMEMDRNVRAGVQAAMANESDLDAIKTMISDAGGGSDSVAITVNQTCACNGSASGCGTWCSADEPPSVFIEISAAQSFSGLMLPAITLESNTHVQLR